MIAQNQIYKCASCGNVLEVLQAGHEHIECCGTPMVLQAENSVDASREKHVPVIEKTAKGVKVKIGSTPHPMLDEHYIQWIELLVGDKSYRRFLKPGMLPEAEFEVTGKDLHARELCNLHGLWKV
jgi:superoxide reductase